MRGAERGHIEQGRQRKVLPRAVDEPIAQRLRGPSCTTGTILHLQRTVGNQATGQWLRRYAGKPLLPRPVDSGVREAPTSNERASVAANNELIQRAVQIDGKQYKKVSDLKGAGYYTGGDETERDIVARMVEQPRVFPFSSKDEWNAEIQMRTELIHGMALINKIARYNWDDESLKLPESHWQSIPFKGGRKEGVQAAFMPKEDKDPSAALTMLFNTDEKVYLDCSSAMVAVHYRALLQVMEAQEKGSFDSALEHQDVVIHPESIEGVKPANAMVSPPADALRETVKVQAIEHLVPGDWVYFESFSDYEETHDGPAAAWAGEHALYMGGDRYMGFGTELLTYDKMVATLIRAYNEQGTNKKHEKRTEPEKSDRSITGTLPGITEVRRMRNPVKYPPGNQ